MSRSDTLSGLTDTFGKDVEAEARLAALNALLEPVERTLRVGREAPQRPVVFVLGPPRSGTTLTSQLLAASGAFSIASNFVARFWKAPALALTIERALGLGAAGSDFTSERGVTHGWGEPHEFGYFWSSWFDLGQDTHALSDELLAKVDAAGLKRALAAMEAAAGRPLAFKNNTWFSFQAGWLARTFPTGIFVVCRRDPFYIAQSLYEQRLALYGDAARWWSIRPAAYPRIVDLEPLEQVAAQAVSISQDLEKALATVPEDRTIQADYARLCDDPRGVLEDVAAACARAGEPVSVDVARVPERFERTDRRRLDSRDAQRLEELVAARLGTSQV